MITEMQTPRTGVQVEERHAPTGSERAKPSKWAILAIVAVGVFMANLDSSIVNISLPFIATAFGIACKLQNWVAHAHFGAYRLLGTKKVENRAHAHSETLHFSLLSRQ